MHPCVSKSIYYCVQKICGLNVFAHLKDLEKTQWYTTEDLKKLQWGKLKKLLQHAYDNTSYYHKKFEKLGFCPKDIDSPEAFRKLPFLTKDDIRGNFPELKAKNIKRFVSDCTSGSTGSPMVFLKEPSTSGHFLAAKYRGHRWHNIDIGDKEAKFWGLALDRKTRLKRHIKDFLLNRSLFVVFDISRATPLKDLKRCQRLKSKYLYGYASALYRFAKLLREKEIDGSALNLRAVICTSEVLYNFERELIESVFGCRAVSEYGACETGIIAFECPEGRMHITVENVYLEILKDDGQPAMPGEVGEIVLTTLDNYAMPFIRYRIGDLAKCISENERCKCGRGLPLIGEIVGRALDTFVTPTGKLLDAHIFYYIMDTAFTHGADIKEFKIIQKNKHRLLIKIVSLHMLSPKYRSYIIKQIVKFIGEDISVEFEQVKSIPLEISGKFRFFVSELPAYKKDKRNE